MTREEAKRLRNDILKNAIRYRLHKMNPSKFPKPQPLYKDSYAMIVDIWDMHQALKGKDLFNTDNLFFKRLTRARTSTSILTFLTLKD